MVGETTVRRRRRKTVPEWIDLMTTVVPRRTLRVCLPRLVQMADFGARRVRWVVHLDNPAPLASRFDSELRDIVALAPLFDDALVLVHPSPVGCNAAFACAFRACEPGRDVLLIEDDKFAQHPVRLADIYALRAPYFNYGRRQARPGGFDTSWWRADLMDAVRTMLPKCRANHVLENELKIKLKGDWPKSRRRRTAFPRDTFVDIGLAALSDYGAVQRKTKGLPVYATEGNTHASQ